MYKTYLNMYSYILPKKTVNAWILWMITHSDKGLRVITLFFFYTEGFDLSLEVDVPWITGEGKLQGGK